MIPREGSGQRPRPSLGIISVHQHGGQKDPKSVHQEEPSRLLLVCTFKGFLPSSSDSECWWEESTPLTNIHYLSYRILSKWKTLQKRKPPACGRVFSFWVFHFERMGQKTLGLCWRDWPIGQSLYSKTLGFLTRWVGVMRMFYRYACLPSIMIEYHYHTYWSHGGSTSACTMCTPTCAYTCLQVWGARRCAHCASTVDDSAVSCELGYLTLWVKLSCSQITALSSPLCLIVISCWCDVGVVIMMLQLVATSWS